MSRIFSILTIASVVVASISSAADATACPRVARRVVYLTQPTQVVRKVVVSSTPVVRTASVVTKTVAHQVPAMPKAQGPSIEIGSTITASANFLGNETGHVLLQMGDATLQCEIVEWNSSNVTFKLPSLGLHKSVASHLTIVLPTGRVARTYDVQLTTPAELIVRKDLQPPPALTISAVSTGEARTAQADGLVLDAEASQAEVAVAN